MTAHSASGVLARRRTTQLARYLRRHGGFWRLTPALPVIAFGLPGLLLTVVLSEWPTQVPWSSFAPLIVVAGLLLRPKQFVAVCLVYAACLTHVGFNYRGWTTMTFMTIGALALVAVLMFYRTISRDRLGVLGNDGEDMLVSLRDRLRELGEMPALPAGWHGESVIHAAYGDKFSGDFLVTSMSPDGRSLQLVLVDISGKGRGAGTRSLLLSGAIGGLLGQVERARLLEAANSYLIREGWQEGFATAVHLALDLQTGQFCIGNAGHPPPLHFTAGSGLWSQLQSVGGPALGILDQPSYPRRCGELQRGDALVIYTDGVVEAPGHDLALGADRLTGSAERLVRDGFRGGAAKLVSGATAGESDDRAVVLIWRS